MSTNKDFCFMMMVTRNDAVSGVTHPGLTLLANSGARETSGAENSRVKSCQSENVNFLTGHMKLSEERLFVFTLHHSWQTWHSL